MLKTWLSGFENMRSTATSSSKAIHRRLIQLSAKLEAAYKQYVEVYEEYVKQLKKSKTKYSKDECPLCKLVDSNTVEPPHTYGCYAWFCPICKREIYWAFQEGKFMEEEGELQKLRTYEYDDILVCMDINMALEHRWINERDFLQKVDEAKKEFPDSTEPRFKENGVAGLLSWSSQTLIWFMKWFGCGSSEEPKQTEQESQFSSRR